MNQKLGGAALVRNGSFTFCQPGPGPSVRAETPRPAGASSLHVHWVFPILHSGPGLLSLSLLPLPTSVPCSCLLPGSTCRKGAGVFVMSSLAIWSGSSMETKPQTHSTHPLTCCATYPAAKTCSHRCLSANTLAFLNTFQSHSKETNHERKDVSSLECIMSP